jgi:uncharacterized protein (DUF58 family)
MFKRLKHLQQMFYAGPASIWVRPPRRNGYQSPTLTAVLWGYALVAAHFTLAGRVIFITSGLLVLYAMFTTAMPIHLLAFAVLMLFVFNLGVGLLLRPRLVVARFLPSAVGAGAESTVEYAVTNLAARPAWDVTVDTLPYPTHVRLTRGYAFAPCLKPGQTVRLAAKFAARRRGRYHLSAARADSAFPFHLWRWGCTAPGRPALVVYPAFTPLERLDLRTGLRYQPGGAAISAHAGESMEFLGCREFRDGDDPRRLHWRSWARVGAPVVKEFREEYLCRTALIIDTYRPMPSMFHMHWAPPEDQVFEAALSLAAAIGENLSGRDYVVDLFAAGPDVYRFTGEASTAYFESMLEILAELKPHRGEPFAEFSAELIEEIAKISSTLFVLLTWNETRRRLMDEVAAAGVSVKAVLITDAGAAAPADLPATVNVLRADDIRAGRCTVL